MSDSLSTVKGIIPLPEFEHDWKINQPYSFKGMGIVIEYLGGDTRTKVTDDGVTVSNVMPCAYGYILRTTDIHGEEIDIYIANNPDPDSHIFIVDQVNPGSGEFDEHKVMIGFSTPEEAVQTYISVFGDGSGVSRLGAISAFSEEAFQTWIAFDGSSLQPASRYEVEGVETKVFFQFKNPGRQTPAPKVPIDEAGGVVLTLPDMSQGPKLETKSSEAGVFDYYLYLYSALDIKQWSVAVDTFCRTLSLASERDTVHIHIVSPGGSVILMGKIISAVYGTKAKVITYAEGIVASAAVGIWAAGHERHIYPGAYFMQHMSAQSLDGKTNDIVAKSAFCMEYVNERLMYLVHTGLFTEVEIEDMAERSEDVYITGTEAIARVGAVSIR